MKNENKKPGWPFASLAATSIILIIIINCSIFVVDSYMHQVSFFILYRAILTSLNSILLAFLSVVFFSYLIKIEALRNYFKGVMKEILFGPSALGLLNRNTILGLRKETSKILFSRGKEINQDIVDIDQAIYESLSGIIASTARISFTCKVHPENPDLMVKKIETSVELINPDMGSEKLDDYIDRGVFFLDIRSILNSTSEQVRKVESFKVSVDGSAKKDLTPKLKTIEEIDKNSKSIYPLKSYLKYDGNEEDITFMEKASFTLVETRIVPKSDNDYYHRIVYPTKRLDFKYHYDIDDYKVNFNCYGNFIKKNQFAPTYLTDNNISVTIDKWLLNGNGIILTVSKAS